MNRNQALIGLSATLLVSGCVSNPEAVLEDASGLQRSERTALDASLAAVESLTVAAGTVQGSTDMQSDGLTAREKEQPSLGSCPIVSVETGKLTSLTLQMTLDFGDDGCNPFGSDYMVSGSASGSLQLSSRNVVLTFNELQSGERMLDGGLEVAFLHGQSDVSLDGSWELNSDDVSTSGTGTLAYDRSTNTTTLQDYSGTTSQGGASWNLTTSSLVVSPSQYESFIPFAGTLTFDGDNTRAIEVTFDEDSPSSGLVQVRIDGGESREISLFEL